MKWSFNFLFPFFVCHAIWSEWNKCKRYDTSRCCVFANCELVADVSDDHVGFLVPFADNSTSIVAFPELWRQR